MKNNRFRNFICFFFKKFFYNFHIYYWFLLMLERLNYKNDVIKFLNKKYQNFYMKIVFLNRVLIINIDINLKEIVCFSNQTYKFKINKPGGFFRLCS